MYVFFYIVVLLQQAIRTGGYCAIVFYYIFVERQAKQMAKPAVETAVTEGKKDQMRTLGEKNSSLMPSNFNQTTDVDGEQKVNCDKKIVRHKDQGKGRVLLK